MERKNGFYWALYGNEWIVIEYAGDLWYTHGNTETIPEAQFDYIFPEPIKEPQGKHLYKKQKA